MLQHSLSRCFNEETQRYTRVAVTSIMDIRRLVCMADVDRHSTLKFKFTLDETRYSEIYCSKLC